MGKHWIVLVNRSPRGPLSLEEVNSLLREKIISRTDLALQISENAEQKSSWKFLWQFPEFDLRAQAKNAQKPEPQLVVEQRKAVNPQEVQKKISSILPDEFALISPEDLIVTAKKNRPRSSESSYSDSLTIEEEDSNDSKSSGTGGFRWGYAAAMVCLFVFGSYVKGIFFAETENQKNRVEPGPTSSFGKPAVRVPARINSLPSTNANSAKISQPPSGGSERTSVPREESKESPKLPIKNVITLDEYQRLKDANAAKERAEEEDKRKAMEESEEMAAQRAEDETTESDENRRDDQVEEESAPRSKSSKRRKLKSGKKRKIADENSNEEEDSRSESDSRNEE